MSQDVNEVPAGGRETSILDAFVDLADSLVADYDPLDFLYRLLDHSMPLTEAAAGAVLLHYEGRLHLVASSDEDAKVVRVFADVATIAVLQQRATADIEAVSRQLHTALEGRVKVEQAKGMVAQATGAGMGESFQMIRRHARSKGERVVDVAAAVTVGDLDIDTLRR